MAEKTYMSTSKRMVVKGIPLALITLVVAITGTSAWMHKASIDRTDSDLLGSSRQQLEARFGRVPFTAQEWDLGNRQSIRKGGLRMQHTQITFRNIRPGRGLGSSPAHKILFWPEDEMVNSFAQRITRGSLKEYDIPMGIAVEQPGPIRVVVLDEDARVSSVHEIRPAFVVAEPH